MLSDEEAEHIREQLLEQLEKLPEEQVKALKKQIKEMDNEELESFVKEQQQDSSECIFCNIIESKIKTHKIFESSNFIAILDIMPSSKGQAIILPKQHVESIIELQDNLAIEMFDIAKKVSNILLKITEAQSISLLIDSKQRISHLALNLIPRYEKDGISFEMRKTPAKENELEELSKKLSKEIYGMLGEQEQEQKEKKDKEKKEEQEDEAQKMFKHVKKRMP